MTLPDGINPAMMPPRDRLDALTEEDLFEVIHHQQRENHVVLGTQFWIDELSRRRTASLLDKIAAAAGQEADHAAEIVRLTAAAAAENSRTATLNQEMRDMTRYMLWLTVSGVGIAAAALVVSLVALVG